MAICRQGKERLLELHTAARTAGTEEEALGFVKESAVIRYGLPVDSLSSEASSALEKYHSVQWRAHKWSGKVVKVPGIHIKEKYGKFLLRAVNLVYRSSAKENKRKSRQVSIDFNY